MGFLPWDHDSEGPRPRIGWKDRHDQLRREAAFRKPDRRTRAALAINRAGRQPGWSAADRRKQRDNSLKQAAAVQGGMSKKQARKKFPTDKQAIRDASKKHSLFYWK